MANKIVKNLSEKELKQRKGDIVYFKMSMMFFFACAAVLFIMRIWSSPLSFYRLCRDPIYLGITGGLFAIFALFYIFKKFIKKHDESLNYISSANFAFITGYVFLASLFFGRADNPTVPLLCGTLAVILLYYVYYIYKIDFFVFTLENVVLLALLWMFAFKTSGFVYVLVKIAIIIALGALICLANRKVGVATVSRKTNKSGINKLLNVTSYISFAIFAVLMLLPYVFPLSGTINFIIMLVQYVAAGVAYTVKLIKEA